MKLENYETLMSWIRRNRFLRKKLARLSHTMFFVIYFHGYMKYKTADFQREIFRITEDGKTKMAVISAFRGSAKSTICGMSFPIWAMISDKARFIVLASQTRNQARQQLKNIREEFENNPLLKNDFGPFAPGFVTDITANTALMMWGGVIVQVKKRRRSDEGMQRNLLAAIMGLARGMRMVIVVDEDVNIHEPEDVLWAITTRVNPQTDILTGTCGGKGHAYMPGERVLGQELISLFEGGIGIDATVPLFAKADYTRARYPVEKFDYSKWFSEREIKEMQAMQSDYFHFLGDKGYA